MDGIVVRAATLADVPGIARVNVQSWREAYAHVVSAERLAQMREEPRAEAWARTIADGEASVWIAAENGGIVGYASSAPRRDEDAPQPLELPTIYLLARLHGSGVAQRLLDAAIGSAAAYLWVLEDNPRARAFYHRNGFVPDGVAKEHPLLGRVIRMVRP